MRTVYAVTLGAGSMALLAWIGLRGLVANLPGLARVDPERRWGTRGRQVVAALVGFGIAGLSSAYAGWPAAGTVAAAVAAAAGAAWYAARPTI